MKPQHFDILGVFAFAFITGFALYELVQGVPPREGFIALALIGVLGLIIDVTFVLKYFVLRKR